LLCAKDVNVVLWDACINHRTEYRALAKVYQ